jgi:tetraacyldisaccharide 4'-kinase
LLREPISSLRRADIVVITRADQVDSPFLAQLRLQVQRHAPKAAWVETEHRAIRLRNWAGQVNSLDWLSDRPVLAFCGLGNPTGFLTTLTQQRARIVDQVLFPDHHHYQSSDIDELTRSLRRHPDIQGVVCTGKDLPKVGLPQIADRPVWSLEVEMHIRSGEQALDDHLARVLATLS